eukprot:CAMPEP_0114670186 /NCGR_PEP_ID=MMETSP0191-20121206/39196_1 /TAXON_ID=126664 /ORGANISM="Sorites sp." /LENGTH=178 /DNA_ID=CAMNT_0001927357 /DNA_START=30 /DNA_END=566 /DNA_ORIENTATION=+
MMKITSAPTFRPSITVPDEDSVLGRESTRDSTGDLLTLRSTGRISTLRSSRNGDRMVSMSRKDQRKMLVRSFLESNGFMHVNEGKSWWGKTCFPLHVAVKQRKATMVKALLLLGARRDVKYRGYTPEEYAQKQHHRWGGYEDILKAFQETSKVLTPSPDDCEANSEDSTEIPDDESTR